MKSALPILTAALAAVAAMWHAVSGKTDNTDSSTAQATIIPPMTASVVQKYAFYGGTDGELADCFLVDESFIRKEFTDVLRAARGYRRLILRGYQFESAKKSNASMLTWLGRNELGQSLQPAPPGETEPEFECITISPIK